MHLNFYAPSPSNYTTYCKAQTECFPMHQCEVCAKSLVLLRREKKFIGTQKTFADVYFSVEVLFVYKRNPNSNANANADEIKMRQVILLPLATNFSSFSSNRLWIYKCTHECIAVEMTTFGWTNLPATKFIFIGSHYLDVQKWVYWKWKLFTNEKEDTWRIYSCTLVRSNIYEPWLFSSIHL